MINDVSKSNFPLSIPVQQSTKPKDSQSKAVFQQVLSLPDDRAQIIASYYKIDPSGSSSQDEELPVHLVRKALSELGVSTEHVDFLSKAYVTLVRTERLMPQLESKFHPDEIANMRSIYGDASLQLLEEEFIQALLLATRQESTKETLPAVNDGIGQANRYQQDSVYSEPSYSSQTPTSTFNEKMPPWPDSPVDVDDIISEKVLKAIRVRSRNDVLDGLIISYNGEIEPVEKHAYFEDGNYVRVLWDKQGSARYDKVIMAKLRDGSELNTISFLLNDDMTKIVNIVDTNRRPNVYLMSQLVDHGFLTEDALTKLDIQSTAQYSGTADNTDTVFKGYGQFLTPDPE